MAAGMNQFRLFKPLSYYRLLFATRRAGPHPTTRRFSSTQEDPLEALQSVPAEEYLQTVIDAVDPSYRFKVAGKHPKAMIHCLLGYNKDDFARKLKDLYLQKFNQFVTQDLATLPVDDTKAPQFKEFLKRYVDNPSIPPKFLLKKLASGRAYRAQLQLLLEDVAPELVPTYLENIQEPNETELMRSIVMEESSSEWKYRLLELLDGVASPEKGVVEDQKIPEEGAERRHQNSLGLQGEVNLTSFLQEKRGTNIVLSNEVVLSNVAIQPHDTYWRGKLNNKVERKAKRGVVYTPNILFTDVQMDGKSQKLDSMVVSCCSDTKTLQIRELWDSKTKLLHPLVIEDMLLKKVPGFQQVLDAPMTRLYHGITNQRFQLSNNQDLTRIGMFGGSIMCPQEASQRVQRGQAGQRIQLGESPEAVMEFLKTGSISSPDVKPYLQTLLEEARRERLVLVAPMPTPL